MHKSIEELQMLEQTLQSVVLQKQAFHMEFEETEKAIQALKAAKGDAYKLIGQILIKTEKEEMTKELSKKKELLELRLKNIEQQEEKIMEKMETLRTEISAK